MLLKNDLASAAHLEHSMTHSNLQNSWGVRGPQGRCLVCFWKHMFSEPRVHKALHSSQPHIRIHNISPYSSYFMPPITPLIRHPHLTTGESATGFTVTLNSVHHLCLKVCAVSSDVPHLLRKTWVHPTKYKNVTTSPSVTHFDSILTTFFINHLLSELKLCFFFNFPPRLLTSLCLFSLFLRLQ
jgi:hypothetical protein